MMKLLKNPFNLSPIPEDLNQVTQIALDESNLNSQSTFSSSDRQAIWDKVENLYKTGTQPAISVCIRHKGDIVMNRSIGHSQGNGPFESASVTKSLMTPETPMCLYSASKAVTAVLMHKLAEQGAVDLLDPVSLYLPEFAKHGKGNITLHQILSHRGGIPGLPRHLDLDTIYDEDKIWQLLCDSKPITVDGRKLTYHAITGGFVFQRVLQKVLGVSIQDYLDQHFRQPMGMKYFTYGLDKAYRQDVTTNYATGPTAVFPASYLVKRALGASFPEAADVSNDPRWMDCVLPAANLYATAEEISRFYQMMLNGGEWNGKQILAPETVKRATHEYGKCAFDKILMIPMRYSAGLMLGANPVGIWGRNTKHAYGHIGLINKMCWADPKKDISVSILTSGLALVSSHIPRLMQLVHEINKRFDG